MCCAFLIEGEPLVSPIGAIAQSEGMRVSCASEIDLDDIKTMRVPCASENPNAKVIAFTLHYKMTREREIRELTSGGGSLDD